METTIPDLLQAVGYLIIAAGVSGLLMRLGAFFEGQ